MSTHEVEGVKMDMEKLAEQLVNLIATTIVLGTWTDDHLPCYLMRIDLKDGRSEETQFWWADPELISAMKYVNESKTAREDAIPFIKDSLESGMEAFNDASDMKDIEEITELGLLKLAGVEEVIETIRINKIANRS